AHALDLLLGGRARPGIVRPGAAEAYVEGVFALPARLRGELGERLPADAEEVVLARRVSAEGRTRAYVNGRSASVGDLRELGGELGLLRYELAEIDEVAPDADEEREALTARDRLRHLEALRAGSLGASEALAPESGEGGAGALLAAAAGALADVEGVDAALDA